MQAYTYFLIHNPTGKFYIGSRYKNVPAGRTPEEDFWIYYFTSSKKIKALIEETGTESFSYRFIYKQQENDEPDRFWWVEQEEILKHLDNPLCLNGYALDRSNGRKKFSKFGVPITDSTKEKISKKVKESIKQKSKEELEITSKKKSENTKRIHKNRSAEEKRKIYNKMLSSREKWTESKKKNIKDKISNSLKNTLANRTEEQLEEYRKKQSDIGWNLKSEEEKQKLRLLRSERMKEVWARRRLTKIEESNNIDNT